MRALGAGLVLLLWLALPAPAQETVVGGLSTDTIALTADFDGSDVLIFGAVRREGPIPEDAGPLDIIISLKGPPRPVLVRQKERRFGIWVNTEAVRVNQVPSYYAIATTRPLGEILTETERLRYGIGLDQAVRLVGAHPRLEDTRPFADAVVRIRQADGLYAQLEGAVRLQEETLFSAQFRLPANLVEGDYAAEFFLVRDRQVINQGTTFITVRKGGVERWIYNLAHDRPTVYGLFAVAVALFAGWLAAAAFRLLKR